MFFGTVLGTVYLLPALVTKWRASSVGLILTVKQAIIITENRCNKKDFLICVKDIWERTEIPIEKLIAHNYAKGDLFNLRDGIIQMTQRNRAVDFQILTAFDLAGRDLKDEVRKAELNNWTFSFDRLSGKQLPPTPCINQWRCSV